MKQLFTFLASVLVTVSMFAQSPQKMSFQTVIRNSSNALLANTTISMRISVLQGSASGSLVYSETHTQISNSNGMVSLQIGAGTVVTGNFSAINWENGPYFLKTETDTEGGVNYTITGTSELMSVPYALYAGSVKSPEKVLFHVYCDHEIEVTEEIVTKMNFNQDIFNVGNGFNLNSDLFTAPVAGYYLFTAFLEIGTAGTADCYFELFLKLNESINYWLDRELINNIGTNHEAATGSVIMHLSKDDTVALYYKQKEIPGTLTNINYLCGYLLSTE